MTLFGSLLGIGCVALCGWWIIGFGDEQAPWIDDAWARQQWLLRNGRDS